MGDVNLNDAGEDELWRQSGERGTPFDKIIEPVIETALIGIKKAVRLRDIGKTDPAADKEPDEGKAWFL